jgi:hypothetical protein
MAVICVGSQCRRRHFSGAVSQGVTPQVQRCATSRCSGPIVCSPAVSAASSADDRHGSATSSMINGSDPPSTSTPGTTWPVTGERRLFCCFCGVGSGGAAQPAGPLLPGQGCLRRRGRWRFAPPLTCESRRPFRAALRGRPAELERSPRRPFTQVRVSAVDDQSHPQKQQ